MFLLDNNYTAIQKILEEGKISKVEISSSQVVFFLEDDTKITIDYAEYEGLDIKAVKETKKEKAKPFALTDYDKELLRKADEMLNNRQMGKQYSRPPLRRLKNVSREYSPIVKKAFKDLGINVEKRY